METYTEGYLVMRNFDPTDPKVICTHTEQTNSQRVDIRTPPQQKETHT
jgi:hypothetical protein